MSLIAQSVGFVGFGKMAEALWQGARNELVPSGHMAFEINLDRQRVAESLGLELAELSTLGQRASLMILCIKPQNLNDLPPIHFGDNQPTIISILAGTSIASLERAFPGKPIVRVMPNTPCMVGDGMSAIAFSSQVSEDIKTDIRRLFYATGDVAIVPEHWMDMITGISGSGPAFIYRLFRAAINAATTEGIPEEVAVQLFAQTLIGAGRMVQKSGKSPEQLTKDVTSPGGTTLAGLTEFDHLEIDRRFMDVILRATQRSKELSKGI